DSGGTRANPSLTSEPEPDQREESNVESLYIDGDYVTSRSGAAIEVENPATEEVIAEVPDADGADIDRAVEAARRAQREWRAVDGLERAGLLHRCADRPEEDADRLAV